MPAALSDFLTPCYGGKLGVIMMKSATAVSEVDSPVIAPVRASLSIRIVRALIATVEWFLRLLVINRNLPEVKTWLRNVSYGEHEKQKLDIVVPLGQGTFPLVIYLHGGGWVSGDKSNFAWITHSLAQNGLVVFSANYRWAPEASFRDQLDDVAGVIQWARKNARQYGADPDRVILAGDSAGAHLACWLHMALHQSSLLNSMALTPPLPIGCLRGSLLFYGVYDLDLAWKMNSAAILTPVRSILRAEPEAVPELVALASPMRQVTAGVAPLFVCSGEVDELHEQSMGLVRALERSSVPHKSLMLDRKQYPEAKHSFINFGRRPAAKIALREAIAFIKETT